MGEIWSPHTAPAIQAEMEIIIKFGSMLENAATTIGIRMPNVPHEVPVEKARPIPIKKIIAGIKFINPTALPETSPATKSFAPSVSVTPFRLQAKTRIMIAGTIALKPSGKLSKHLRSFKTRRPKYQITVTIKAAKLPSTRPTEASLLPKASTKPLCASPLAKNPPV